MNNPAESLPQGSGTNVAAMSPSSDVHKGAGYGILGGTFDPPHLAHLILAQEVHARLGLDRVWFLPAGDPPHKRGKPITPAPHRRAMVERAIAGDARFALSTVDLDRSGPSYTVDTLRALRALWGEETHMSLILGWDMLLYLPKWHDAPGVVALADRIVAAHRPGFASDPATLERLEAAVPGLAGKLALVPSPELDVSGTVLRERVASGLPIRYFVPDAVADYIKAHDLYRIAASDVEHRGAIQ